MKDTFGDEITLDYYGFGQINLSCQNSSTGKYDSMQLTPKKVRRLAKKLKRAAKKVEGR